LNRMRKGVLIADDHPLILNGVKELLAPHFEVVGVVTDGRALIEEAKRLRPDIIVLDIHMPELNGVEAARQICKLMPRTRLIFLTQQLDPNYVQAALRAGAMGFVAKQAATTELLEAVQAVLRNHYFVTQLAASSAPDKRALHDPRINPVDLFGAKLTSRQREVLQLVAEGKTIREIAETLRISVKTVEFHKSMLMDELGLRTTAELTRYAIANGLVKG
jgi:DNA-binding NarL/FixJ family response regulator